MNNLSPNTAAERSPQPEKRVETTHTNTEHARPRAEHMGEADPQYATREQERDTAKFEALGAASTIEEVKRPHHESAPQHHGPLTKKQLDKNSIAQ